MRHSVALHDLFTFLAIAITFRNVDLKQASFNNLTTSCSVWTKQGHIPDSKTSPDLHALVKKYQMHKCNAYYKRNLKFGKTCV